MRDPKTVIVTGGAGFIGSAVVRHLIRSTSVRVVVVDKLTYAGNLATLSEVAESERFAFERVDICDREGLRAVFGRHDPDAILHLAAESHVDRSIDGPGQFVLTNVVGTYELLQITREHWEALRARRKADFIFHHVSTDEVYGDLGVGGTGAFTEETSYEPSSPYSATKAASDHLVRAWHRTYGLPTIVTNCSNNYGPYQFPEKLIPLMILNAVEGRPLPVYGDGRQVRDWLYVEDHADALWKVLRRGVVGATYNIGGGSERQNIEVVHAICATLEQMQVAKPPGVKDFVDLVTHVADRPGHDIRYAIDHSKITREIGWSPAETFESGLWRTVEWYMSNPNWRAVVESGKKARARMGVPGRGESQ